MAVSVMVGPFGAGGRLGAGQLGARGNRACGGVRPRRGPGAGEADLRPVSGSELAGAANVLRRRRGDRGRGLTPSPQSPITLAAPLTGFVLARRRFGRREAADVADRAMRAPQAKEKPRRLGRRGLSGRCSGDVAGVQRAGVFVVGAGGRGVAAIGDLVFAFVADRIEGPSAADVVDSGRVVVGGGQLHGSGR